MDRLNDDELLIIFKLMTINERAQLRLVKSSFKHLIDSIEFKELVLFEKVQPVAGQFQNGDYYGLDKCICVDNLKKFFNCKPMLKSMKNIRKLKIVGDGHCLIYVNKNNFNNFIQLDSTFEELTYFECKYACFNKPTIFSNSPKLDTLILESNVMRRPDYLIGKIFKTQVDFENFDKSSVMEYSMVRLYGFDNLKCSIKQLTFHNGTLIDADFFKLCHKTGIFEEIERINMIFLKDLDVLTCLSDNFKHLKKISCLIGNNIDDFISIRPAEYNQTARKLRTDLSVSIWGFSFDKQSVSILPTFFAKYRYLISALNNVTINLILSKKTKHLIQILMQDFNMYEHLLDELLRLINFMRYSFEFYDENLFKKLINCSSVFFCIDDVKKLDITEFENVLNTLSITSELHLYNHIFKINYSNKMLSLIPIYCEKITHFVLENYCENIDFNFLFKLYRLKSIRMKLRYAINQTTYIEIIRAIKDLGFFEVLFIKPANLEKKQLDEFKKLVLQSTNEEKKAKKCDFKIQIFTSIKGSEKVINYIFFKENFAIGYANDRYDPSPKKLFNANF